ncbi:acyltransferase family protein [Cystobacter fuscus]|uniref:acyltransferase family protein n=1 Tax=Cystobacter fuscus TaxID=43 RepID=UPI0037BE6CBD
MPAASSASKTSSERLHALDALRGFALLLGVVLHATLSFVPGFKYTGWPIIDNSPSATLGLAFFVIHLFRMPIFFLLAGFFARRQFHRQSTKGFLKERAKRILLPLVFGFVLVAPMNVLLIVVVIMPNLKEPLTSLVPERKILPIPLAHLWFLWVLYWYYLLFLGARKLSSLLSKGEGASVSGIVERALTWSCSRGLEPVILALPLATSLFFFDPWHLWEGVPTPNMDLVPQLPVFVGYGVAFVFGWFLQKHSHFMLGWRQRWGTYLILALVVTAVMTSLGGFTPQSSLVIVDGAPKLTPLVGTAKLLCALGYGLSAWLWALGLIGASLHFFSEFSPWRRYLSDSSYWLYIIHLPLIMALQALMMDWPLHWGLKYPLILASAVPVLLLSYHYLVRSTWIGVMLNGRSLPRTIAPKSELQGANAEVG